MIAGLVFALALVNTQGSPVNLSEELDSLLRLTGDTNLVSLSHGTMLQIHPLIQDCYGKEDIEAIESRIKEKLSPDVFRRALQNTYQKRRDPKMFSEARHTFSTPARQKLKRLEKLWNAPEGRKAYQEFLKSGMPKVPNARKEYIRKMVENSDSHILLANLFGMAVNAQFDAALALKGKPEKCSEGGLREKIADFGEDMRKNIKEVIIPDLIFLYVDFSDKEVEQIFASEKDPGYLWYDKFRWEEIKVGFENAVSSVQSRK